MIIGFFLGHNGLPITSDSVFRRIFDPEIHRERVEALLTAIFGRSVKIVQVLPREGSQLTERGSFVVMDILVNPLYLTFNIILGQLFGSLLFYTFSCNP